MAQALEGSLLDSVPAALFWPVLSGLLLASALVLRVISNSFTFKAPPIFEGFPFVGGLIKFARVSRQSHCD